MRLLVKSSQQKQSGLTLLELLIAMAIGTLLILGATSMFIANKRVYKEVDFQGRLAENARFGMEMMIRDLRMTGFIGCAVQQDVVNNLAILDSGGEQDPRHLLSYVTKNTSPCSKGFSTTGCVQANAIEGRDAGTPEWLPSQSTDPTDTGLTLDANSDAFTVRFMEDTNTNLCTNMTSTSSDLIVNNQSGTVTIPAGLFISGGIFAAADCEATNIFQITANAAGTGAGSGPFELLHGTGSGGNPGNAVATLSKIYDAGTSSNCAASPVDIFIFRARRYFVASEASIQDGRPALYRQTFEIDASNLGSGGLPEVFSERLIDGVENMQILYGEDTSGDRVPNAYRTAVNVDDWSNIVSVKLAVLFATVEQDFAAPADTKSDYQLLDSAPFDPTPAANDSRRRKIIEASVSLRNRQLSL